MNLFNQYETQDLKKEVTYSIDNKRNYDFVNPVTIKTDGFEKDAVNIKFLQPTNSNSKVKKSISFTFHLDELEKLVEDFSILKDKLKNNMEKVTEYPASEIKNILYAIMKIISDMLLEEMTKFLDQDYQYIKKIIKYSSVR